MGILEDEAKGEEKKTKRKEKKVQEKKSLKDECGNIRKRFKAERISKAVDFAMNADCTKKNPVYTYTIENDLKQPQEPQPVIIPFVKSSSSKSEKKSPEPTKPESPKTREPKK